MNRILVCPVFALLSSTMKICIILYEGIVCDILHVYW